MAEQETVGEAAQEHDNSFLAYQRAKTFVELEQFKKQYNLHELEDIPPLSDAELEAVKKAIIKSPHHDATRDENEKTFMRYVTGEETFPLTVNEEILAHLVDYFLRKWAAFEIYSLDPGITQDLSQKGETTPIYFKPRGLGRTTSDNKEEEDGGTGRATGWMLIETESSLKTGRINLFGEYAGLAPFKEALTQMIEKASHKGWNTIGLSGYLPDLAWVLVQEHNIRHPNNLLEVVNYMPEKPSLDRYTDLLRDVVAQTLHLQAAGL